MKNNFQIELPCDNDGFVLMQCPICGELFKLRPDEIEDDQVLKICCPLCGLSSTSFFTDEVFELACIKSENIVSGQIHGEMKKLEKQITSKSISFKAGKKPKPKPEPMNI